MTSSRAVTTCQMLARGVKPELGTFEDTLARIGLENERRIEYIKTLAIVNAIISVGNHIGAMMSESPSSSKGKDGLQKTMEALKKLLLPEEAERTERSALDAKAILEKEATSGPIKFRPMSHSKSKKGRVKVKL